MLSRGPVSLRPLEPSDLERLHDWSRDLDIEIRSGWATPLSRAAFERRWLERILDPPEDARFFAIELDGNLVGRIDLCQIDREHRRAALGLIVGDRQARRRGVGASSVILLLDYAFTVECLDRVLAEVYTFNEPARRLMERVGFTCEGLLREQDMQNGRRQDLWVFGILRPEFYRAHQTVFTLRDAP